VPAKIFDIFHQLSRDHNESKTQAVARSTRRGKSAKAFISQPMPKGVGSAHIGLQLNAGNYLIDGQLIKEPDEFIWDVEYENAPFQEKAHGFLWLDDLVANGSHACLSKARLWFLEWVERFGDGYNSAWTPELAGGRVIRMVNHAIVLLGNSKELDAKHYFETISHHARFLKKRNQFAPDGLPKFRALAGYIYSALALEEFASDLEPAMRALAKECEAYVAQDGGIPTRNPEELLEIFMLLVWIEQGMTSASFHPDRALLDAIERMAPAIRSLRIGDGRLVAFQGANSVASAVVAQVLSDAGTRSKTTQARVMGFARASAKETILVMDVGGGVSDSASVLAFEVSAGDQHIFQSTGFCHSLASSSYSVAAIEGAKLEASRMQVFPMTELQPNAGAATLGAVHAGYQEVYGLRYSRKLELDKNGRILFGSDSFKCMTDKDKAVFDKMTTGHEGKMLGYALHFHVAPDVDVELDLGGTAVSLKLPNGDVWIFKASFGILALKDSTYFEPDRIKPRATKQIVVSSEVVNYEGAVTWMLTRLVQERTYS
jgi:uncharacterized heparinase superfamily protein